MGKKATKGKKEVMTQQQKLFAYAYFNNKGNGTQAAIEAGYSKKSADMQASRLLTYAKVQDLIKKLNDRLEDKAIITREEVLKEYRKIALFDLRTLYDSNNALKNIADFSDEAGAAITGIDIDEILEYDAILGAKVKTGNTVKVRLNGKIAALDSIRDTMGWKGVTKIAQTDPQGNNIQIDPLQLTNAKLTIHVVSTPAAGPEPSTNEGAMQP